MMAYQQQLPASWYAVPYTSREREGLLRTFNIDSVPRALIFAPSGKLVCENAAATPMALANLDYWAATAAREDAQLQNNGKQ